MIAKIPGIWWSHPFVVSKSEPKRKSVCYTLTHVWYDLEDTKVVERERTVFSLNETLWVYEVDARPIRSRRRVQEKTAMAVERVSDNETNKKYNPEGDVARQRKLTN